MTERKKRNVGATVAPLGSTPENVETIPVVNHHPLAEWPPYTHVSHGTVWTYRQTEHGDAWRNDGPAPENVECPTCGGEGRLVNLGRFGDPYSGCPDCGYCE